MPAIGTSHVLADILTTKFTRM